ncbi:LysR family transcriptional regulator [Phenylobacterium sp. LjRoot219]|uniref:LysR family transcriptional regulator n=1 Tax=Phenylobacterium sp. LjRoot219 TaxID=3342283 RepID=UPI003ECCE54C
MDIRQLRNFVKIAELGSISRAAEALGMAQPSLSQQVLRLEDEFGCKLFRRNARGVTTTEAGAVLQRHAVLMVAVEEDAVAEMRRVAEALLSNVTLAMPGSISRLLAVALTEAVMELEPISLRLREGASGEIRSMLLDGGVDFGLLYDAEPLDQFEIKRLAREDLYLIGPPGKFAGIGGEPVITLPELGGLPLIAPGPRHGLRMALEREAQRLGVRLKVATELDALEAIVGVVADGRGYSIMPLSAVETELRREAISAARIDGSFGRTLCLARLPTLSVSEPSRVVEALVIKLLGQLIKKGRWLAMPDADLNLARETP